VTLLDFLRADDTARGLLANVLASPYDDLPRLILADRLEESGQPECIARAEFIRLQIELAKVGDDAACPVCPKCLNDGETCPTPRCRGPRCKMLRRKQQLFDRHGYAWAQEALTGPYAAFEARIQREVTEPRGLRPRPVTWVEYLEGFVERMNRDRPDSWMFALDVVTFRRGFAAEIRLPLAAFMEQAGALFRAAPLERVTLTDREPSDDLGSSHWFWQPLYGGVAVCRRPHCVPIELKPEGEQSPHDNYHGSREQAVETLSAWCVGYGRRQAKLSDLAPEPA